MDTSDLGKGNRTVLHQGKVVLFAFFCLYSSGCALSLTPVVSGAAPPSAAPTAAVPERAPSASPEIVRVQLPTDLTGSTQVEVTPGANGAAPSIRLSPSTPETVAQLPVATDFRLTAEQNVLDALQAELALRLEGAVTGSVNWYSSQPTVISVDTQGRARALGNGEAEVTAVVGQQRATLRLRVQQQPHSLKITPTQLEALPNARHQLSIEVRDRLGHLVTAPALQWQVVDSALATVEAGGLLTTTAMAGSTTIMASAGAQQQRIALTVLATTQAGPGPGNLVLQPEF